jgi:hypothetical protein
MATSRDDRTMRDLYRTLTPTERARLVARFVREDNVPGLRPVRDSLPSEAACTAYNRALHIAADMPPHLLLCTEVLQRGMEQARARLAAVLVPRLQQRRVLLHLNDLWILCGGYPVTQGEYQSIITQEREELRPLDELAGYIAEAYCGDDAATVCPAVAAWLDADAPDDETAEEAQAAVRALLDAAIAAGELPAPVQTPKGPALPRGAFTDWLHQREPAAHEPYPPEWHVAAVYVLRGLFCRWDVRPDEEAEQVRRRRAEMVRTLAGLTGLSAEQIPPADPPASRDEWERQRAAVEAAWPWTPTADETAEVQDTATFYSDIRRETLALLAAVETVQREEFGGEDPLQPRIRAALEDLRTAEQSMTAGWGDGAGLYRYREDWPALPTPDHERLQDRQTEFVELLVNVF